MTYKELTKAYEREDHLGGGGFGQVFKASIQLCFKLMN